MADFSGQALDNLGGDMTEPSFDSAAVKGATLTITFDEDLDTSSTPAGTAFTVKVASSKVSLANTNPVAVSGSAVTLTLANAVTAGQAVTVSYTKPASNPIQDRAGNDAVDLTDKAVTNNTPERAVSSVAFTSAPTGVLAYSTIGDPVQVTVTFTEEVTVTGTPRIALSPAFGPNGETRYAVYDSGSPGDALVFRYTLAEGDTSGGTLVSVAANALDADGADGSATIRVGTEDVSPDHAAAASALPVEVLRPAIVTAYVHPAPKVDANLDGVPDTFTLDDDNKSFEVRVHFRNDVWHMVVENEDPSGNIQVKVAIDRGAVDGEADLDYSSVHLGVLRFGPYSVTATDADNDGIKILRDAGNLIRLSGMPTPTIKASRRAGGNRADLRTDADLGVRASPDVTVLARVRASNAAPAGMDFTRSTATDTDLAFAKQDFAIADSDGDPLKEIRIATLPETAEGMLLLGGKAITAAMLPKTVTHTELNAGSLTFDPDSAPDGDASFTFHVVDSFSAASASTNTATIRVTTNSAAAFAADSISFSIAENNADAATVGTVTATDAESDTLTYSLASGGDNDSFTIDSADGTIKVKSGVTLDYETQSSYTVTARVTDGKDSDGNVEQTATIDDTITVTITVTDADEAMGPDVTASFSSVPTTHDGSAAFKARIKFSEAVAITNEATFRDHSVEALGGTVTDADRLGWDSWEITVDPTGGGAVVVRVLATASCANQGALCTSDGSRLVEAVEAIVRGPDTAVVTIAPVSTTITEGEPAEFRLRRTGGTGPALTVGLSVTGAGDFIAGSPPQSAAFLAGESTASLNIPTEDDQLPDAGALLTVEVSADADSPPTYVLGSATRAVLQVSDNDGGAAPPALPGTSSTTVRRKPDPLQLALWTDEPAYRAGETVRLYHTIHPHDDRGQYRVLAWLEPVEGEAPEPGLWRFVLELRPGAEHEQYEKPDEPMRTRRAWASFTVAERSQLLNRRNFDREIRDDFTLRSDTIYNLRHQLFVHDGCTLTIEPGTVVRAWGPNTAIIVEPGGSIVAEGTPEAPVVLTCSLPVGQRGPGCWGGLRILGRGPVTRLEGVAPGVLPAERPVYGGQEAETSAGVPRYVRVEFAGASGDPEVPGPAIGLYGAAAAPSSTTCRRAPASATASPSTAAPPSATTASPASRATPACRGSAAGAAGRLTCTSSTAKAVSTASPAPTTTRATTSSPARCPRCPTSPWSTPAPTASASAGGWRYGSPPAAA